MPQFTQTEQAILNLFKVGTRFQLEGKTWEVIKSAKPRPSSGECKTDIYVLAKSGNDEREIKISVKQENADFLENKMTLERATHIFGNHVDEILRNSISAIKTSFEQQCLVHFIGRGHTQAQSVKLGWRFELLNKPGGELSGELKLTQEQIADIYFGIHLSMDKKNAKVNEVEIQNSGVANYILFVDQDQDISLEECLANMITMDEYLGNPHKIYFACKALNYRANANQGQGKWEGDRSLSVYVEWSIIDGKLQGELKFNNPLHVKGNEIGHNLQNLLKQLGITANNFDDLKSKLSDSVKYLG